jgi:hypothetical protein
MFVDLVVIEEHRNKKRKGVHFDASNEGSRAFQKSSIGEVT